VIALAGAQTIASAGPARDADANVYTNFCGHTYTTATARRRRAAADRPHGYPLRAQRRSAAATSAAR